MAKHAQRASIGSHPPQSKIRSLLASQVEWRALSALKPYPNNPRNHPDSQIGALMKSIRRGWTNPILIDEDNTILAGHGRLEAAKRLLISSVPTLMLSRLSDAEKRAIVISDNKLPQKATWDFALLSGHMKDLIAIDFDVELTGFSTGEVDILLDDPDSGKADRADAIDEAFLQQPVVSRLGDLWELGRHRIYCGDALQANSNRALLGDERAQMIVTDVPYNVPINGHACGRGKIRHREFAMASGEMSEIEFIAFLETAMERVIGCSQNGSIHYWFIDWRHLYELQRAARNHYGAFKNLLVWNKSNAGQGSLYRSKHELIAVFKSGDAPHINNVELGSNGRYRTNVLDYPGGTSPNSKRQEELALHPTLKPTALIADLMRDCSRRNGIILDPFAGSGTVCLAAERAGRVARAIEIDPIYVDVAVARWEQMTGGQAVHSESGKSFLETKAERGTSTEPTTAPRPPARRISRKRG
jgi:DNA modification methylase